MGVSADPTSENHWNGGIYDLNSVIISRVLRIIAYQNKFNSLYDEIFTIDRFLE